MQSALSFVSFSFVANRKEVLAVCGIQAQSIRKKPQGVAGLRTQKVLARVRYFWLYYIYVRIVIFFILVMHNQTNYKCLLQFVQTDNASSV